MIVKYKENKTCFDQPREMGNKLQLARARKFCTTQAKIFKKILFSKLRKTYSCQINVLT